MSGKRPLATFVVNIDCAQNCEGSAQNIVGWLLVHVYWKKVPIRGYASLGNVLDVYDVLFVSSREFIHRLSVKDEFCIDSE